MSCGKWVETPPDLFVTVPTLAEFLFIDQNKLSTPESYGGPSRISSISQGVGYIVPKTKTHKNHGANGRMPMQGAPE